MEKTITFTLEDALMSPISFAMLSGAGVIHGREEKEEDGVKYDAQKIYVHTNYENVVEKVGDSYVVALTDEDRNGATIVVSKEAPVYPVTLDSAGAQADYLSAVVEDQVKILENGALSDAEINQRGEVQADGKTIAFVLAKDEPGDDRQDTPVKIGDTVRIDCYEVHTDDAYEMQIDAETFAGYYYIEASTLFRDEETGEDLPAEFVIPRGKIQSNFTFTMANSGDPSEITRMAA